MCSSIKLPSRKQNYHSQTNAGSVDFNREREGFNYKN